MAVIDFQDQSTTLFQERGAHSEKKKAKYWVNIGYATQGMNSQTNEMEEVFISLPFGIPLDTMSLADLKGGDFNRRLARSKNALLQTFLDKAESLEAGEEQILDMGAKLQVRIRRVTEETEQSAGDTFQPFTF